MAKVYRSIISVADRYVPTKLRPLWEHDAGPKTVFFWAPAFKWSLVIAGLGDLNRPVESLSIPQSASLAATGLIWSRNVKEMLQAPFRTRPDALVAASVDDFRRPIDKVSVSQSASLAATGLIWTRYCLVIKPVNYSLSLCNFALGLANGIQCFRAIRFQQGLKDLP